MSFVPTLRRRPLLMGLICSLAALAEAAPAPVEPGSQAPAFELPTPEGGTPVRLAQWHGQVVLLDFWASWCGPCRQSFPWMSAMQRKYADQGLVVVAVNVDSRSSDAQEFLRTTPAGFVVALDPQGSTPRSYQAKAMPTSVLIGRDGRVIQRHAGFKPSETPQLEASLRKALGLQ